MTPVSPAISIQANDVTLDLNGRLLAGDASGTFIQIGGGFSDVTIRNGRLSGGATGVSYFAVTSTVRLEIESIEIFKTAAPIILQNVGYVDVLSCHISGAGTDAILVQNSPSGPFGGRFVNNTIENVSGRGINLGFLRGGDVRGNLVTQFGSGLSDAVGVGIGAPVSNDQGGNSVENNVVSSGKTGIGIGIYDGTNNLLANNVVTGCNTGIVIATAGNRLVGNVASGNSIGIGIGSVTGLAPFPDRNTVAQNHIQGNASDGIKMASSYNLVDDNLIEGNGLGISFWAP